MDQKKSFDNCGSSARSDSHHPLWIINVFSRSILLGIPPTFDPMIRSLGGRSVCLIFSSRLAGVSFIRKVKLVTASASSFLSHTVRTVRRFLRRLGFCTLGGRFIFETHSRDRPAFISDDRLPRCRSMPNRSTDHHHRSDGLFLKG